MTRLPVQKSTEENLTDEEALAFVKQWKKETV